MSGGRLFRLLRGLYGRALETPVLGALLARAVRSAAVKSATTRAAGRATVSASSWSDLRAALEAFATSGRPIVFGPWNGGLAEEILYWLPFLRWAAEEFHFPRGQLAAVTASGRASWYLPFCRQAIEVEAPVGGQAALAAVRAADPAFGGARLFESGGFLQICARYRAGVEAIWTVTRAARYARAPSPGAGACGLPERFVAVAIDGVDADFGERLSETIGLAAVRVDPVVLTKLRPREGVAAAIETLGAATGLVTACWEAALVAVQQGVPAITIGDGAHIAQADLDIANRLARAASTPLVVLGREELLGEPALAALAPTTR